MPDLDDRYVVVFEGGFPPLQPGDTLRVTTGQRYPVTGGAPVPYVVNAEVETALGGRIGLSATVRRVRA